MEEAEPEATTPKAVMATSTAAFAAQGEAEAPCAAPGEPEATNPKAAVATSEAPQLAPEEPHATPPQAPTDEWNSWSPNSKKTFLQLFSDEEPKGDEPILVPADVEPKAQDPGVEAGRGESMATGTEGEPRAEDPGNEAGGAIPQQPGQAALDKYEPTALSSRNSSLLFHHQAQ